MAEPKQKSLEPPFLWRLPTIWQTPQWQQANQWRWFVYNQPIAMLCRQRLINHLLTLPWEIAARNPDEQDACEEDCHYYEKWILKDFDLIFDLMWQDALDLPIGGNAEIIRWPAGTKPVIKEGDEEYKVTRDHPKGHPFRLVNIDGATLFPTYDEDIPLAQRIPEIDTVVYFTPDSIGRVGIQPRTEMRLRGYFKPPPEQIFLAMTMVNYGDHYYSDLLRNVPPVGILDLMDMSQKSATEWAGSIRTLFEGTDPFKIPVLYEHTSAARFIPFGKSPQELLFNDTYLKYARVVAASYGLTLGNIGLEPKGETLAGSIRDDRQAESGYEFVEEKTKGLIDDQILPPYLEWRSKKQNYEALTGKGRAFLVTAQALKAAKDSNAITDLEMQTQLVRDGFITVEVEKPKEKPMLPNGMPQNGLGQPANGDTKQIADKVAPAEGGRGDVTEKADYKYASTQFDMPDTVIRYVKALQIRIDPNDLAEDGTEENPHVTIKYGLTNDNPQPVKAVASQFQPFHIQLGGISLFENEEFDVVKLEIESDTLKQLNKAIAKTGSVDTHPGYTPHLTIAYVKPGMGQKYLDLPIRPQSALVSVISHSTSDGYITKIPLGYFEEKALVTRADMATPVTKSLESIVKRASDNRLKKLARTVTRIVFDTIQKADLDNDELERLIDGENWYRISSIPGLVEAYIDAFSTGARQAATEIIRSLGDAGFTLDFDLTNPRTLAQLEKKAALLVRRINDGTKYYLKRMLASGVEEGLASPEIAALIKEGATVDDILKSEGFLDDVIKAVKAELETLTPARVESIVNTEINRAESEGRLKQWQEMGLTRKRWVTDQNPCDICRSNAALGFVEMAHIFDDVFEGTLTPPGHPQVCRCHIEFDEQELMSKAGMLKVWDGGQAVSVTKSAINPVFVNLSMPPAPAPPTIMMPKQKAAPIYIENRVVVPETTVKNEITTPPAEVTVQPTAIIQVDPPVINNIIEPAQVEVNVEPTPVEISFTPELKATLDVPNTEEIIEIEERDHIGLVKRARKTRKRK